jgi:phosphatidate cytidylyltransferase
MLKQRLIVVNLLIPLVIGLIVLGGWFYTFLVLILFGIAAWELWKLFFQGGFAPSRELMVGGVLAVILVQQVWEDQKDLIFSLSLLGTMVVTVIQFERGLQNAALNFCITLGGIFYLGVSGSFFIALRNLPEGMWWMLLILPAIWFADGGAYVIGRKFGHHKISRLVSPNKSWEGYLAGIVTGALLTGLIAALWGLRCSAITAERGFVLGLMIAVISPIGDLAESMIKREFGVKDSGNLLPGHGGFLDRIDSWIVAAPVGYYLITWLWV